MSIDPIGVAMFTFIGGFALGWKLCLNSCRRILRSKGIARKDGKPW